MNRQKERQSAIISDAEALAMEASTIKTTKKGVKQGFTKTTKTTTATRNPADSSSADGVKSNPDPSSYRFYNAPGLRIPLYDARGKRITHARDGRVIAHKTSREKVLDEYVRKYAGDAKVQEMEGKPQGTAKWSKDQIGDWITEVETRAFGKGPKGKTMKERKEEGKGGENGVQRQANQKPLKGKATRSMSEDVRMLLAIEEPVQAPAWKKRPADGNNATVAVRGHIAMINRDANGKRKAPAQGSQGASKKSKLDSTNAAALPINTKKAPASTPAQAPSSTRMAPCNRKTNTSTSMAPPTRGPATSSASTIQAPRAPPSHRPQQQAPRPDTFPWNHADDDLYLAHVSDVYKLQTHPFLSTFSLDPNFEATGAPTQTTPVRTLPLPASRTHLLVSATAHNRLTPTIHATLLPHRDLENQRAAAIAGKKIPPPHRRRKNIVAPFLKPGTHGWDYERHAWGFEGDKDLETGVGHQVDPEDERRLAEGEMSLEEFGEKYPGERGGRGGMWPCGCVVVGEEGESEQE